MILINNQSLAGTKTVIKSKLMFKLILYKRVHQFVQKDVRKLPLHDLRVGPFWEMMHVIEWLCLQLPAGGAWNTSFSVKLLEQKHHVWASLLIYPLCSSECLRCGNVHAELNIRKLFHAVPAQNTRVSPTLTGLCAFDDVRFFHCSLVCN